MFQRMMSVSVVLIFLIVSFLDAQIITLEQAIEEACSNNYLLQTAVENTRAVKSSFWEAVSPGNPELFREWEDVPWSSRNLQNWGERKTGLVQQFDFPLAYFYRGQQVNRHSRASEAEELVVKNHLICEVKKRFFKVLLLEEKKALFQKIKDLSVDNFRMARIRVLSGDASPYDSLKIKVDLVEAENKLLAVKAEYKLSKTRFAEVLGRAYDQAIQPTGKLVFEKQEISIDSLEQIALEFHPGLRKHEMQYQAHQAKLKLAWSDMMPGVSLKYFKFELQGLPDSRRHGAEIGLSIPLWFFLKDQGRIRAAGHEVRAAKSSLKGEELKILLKLQQSITDLEIARNQAANYHFNTIKEVEELVRIASSSYEAGEMGYLELSDAISTWNRVKAGYFESLYNLNAARADLEEAVGKRLFK